MMQRDQYEFLASLPRPSACSDAAEGTMIDMLLRGWAELIDDEIRLTHPGRTALADFKAARFTSV
jgi:hypothetical protein